MLGVVYAVATVRSAPFFLSFFSFYYTSLRSVLLLFAGLFSSFKKRKKSRTILGPPLFFFGGWTERDNRVIATKQSTFERLSLVTRRAKRASYSHFKDTKRYECSSFRDSLKNIYI